MQDYIAQALTAYAETALWTNHDEAGDNLDALHTVDDFDPESLGRMGEDVAAFVTDNWEDLTGITAEAAGHDFYLTRNGHGAGFWDRGLGDLGDRLTRSAKPFGETYAYVGDDNFVHVA